MSLLIDGYNLLNAVGITATGRRGSSLERSRSALLNFLAESLPPGELAKTTIVFDATGAPPGLPKLLEHQGITVRFAPRGEEADGVIEELIEAESAPRDVTVVSSDHRLHRAGRRRKARAVDSDVWFHELLAARAEREATPPLPARPQVPLSEAEIERWLNAFGGEEALEKLAAGPPPPPPETPSSPPSKPSPPPDKLTPTEAHDLANPFPLGYGEDLLEGEG